MGVASMVTQAVSTIAGGLLSYALTPSRPSVTIDNTNWNMLQQMQQMQQQELLRRTQEQADPDGDEARARQEEAKRREELRQQQMYGYDVITGDAGADTSRIGVRNQVLGADDDYDDEDFD